MKYKKINDTTGFFILKDKQKLLLKEHKKFNGKKIKKINIIGDISILDDEAVIDFIEWCIEDEKVFYKDYLKNDFFTELTPLQSFKTYLKSVNVSEKSIIGTYEYFI